MAMTRIKKVKTKKEFDTVVDDFLTQGYRVSEEGNQTVMLQQQTWGSAGGHALWALLTVWWTCGIGNFGYAIYAHFDAPKVLVKLDDAKRRDADDEDDKE